MVQQTLLSLTRRRQSQYSHCTKTKKAKATTVHGILAIMAILLMNPNGSQLVVIGDFSVKWDTAGMGSVRAEDWNYVRGGCVFYRGQTALLPLQQLVSLRPNLFTSTVSEWLFLDSMCRDELDVKHSKISFFYWPPISWPCYQDCSYCKSVMPSWVMLPSSTYSPKSVSTYYILFMCGHNQLVLLRMWCLRCTSSYCIWKHLLDKHADPLADPVLIR